jgi:hypothetical protein
MEKVMKEHHRPPLTQHSLEVRKLLERMWEPMASRRPSCWEIVRQLEQERFWLPGTNQREFQSYIQYLNQRERQMGSSSAAMQRSLRQISLSGTLVERLNDPEIFREEDTLTAKLIRSLGFITGTGDTRNEEVEGAVRESLRRHRCLTVAEIIRSVAEPVNPPEQEEMLQ